MPEFKTVYGELSAPDWEQDLIVRSLRLYGEWAFAEQQLLAPLLRGTDRFWMLVRFWAPSVWVSASLRRPHRRVWSVWNRGWRCCRI